MGKSDFTGTHLVFLAKDDYSMPDSMNFKVWLEKANNDLRAAEAISALNRDRMADSIWFHCHQVAEKSFKAFLIVTTKSLRHTTDLNSLLKRCVKMETGFTRFQAFADSLNRCYSAAQYPSVKPVLFSREETQTALNQAREILAFTRKKLTTDQPEETQQ
jgi:HEPN domain-containing protein